MDSTTRPMNQPTPSMQVVANFAGFDGHYRNYKEGIITREKMLAQLDQFMVEMREISKHLASNRWKKTERSEGEEAL